MARGAIRIPDIEDRSFYTTEEVSQKLGKSMQSAYRYVRKAKDYARRNNLYSPYVLEMKNRVPKQLMHDLYMI